MKVLLIDVNCKGSSTGQIVYNLYSYLNSHGDEAAICYGRGELITERNIFKFGYDWETYLHALLTRITGFTGCFSFFSTTRLINYIEKYKPDVIHIHELHAYFINIKQLLNYLADKKIPVVHTLHCEFSYTGKCGHSVECEKWKRECGSCPHLREYPSTLFFDHTKYMLRKKKKAFSKLQGPVFIAPSEWLYSRMKESFLKNNKLALIHNSIDTNIFSPRDKKALRKEFGFNDDVKIVLAVAPGLMADNKGGKYVLRIAEKLQDALFILIGSDEEPYIKKNVHNMGKIFDKELLSKFYSLADVFVICSKNENFPTTCIEAVCCGIPVVGFESGGVKEVVPPELGKFVSYGDTSDLISAIKLFTNEKEIKEKYLYEKMKQHYSLERMCKEYIEIYKSVREV